MLYRPNFCAHCGEKVERTEWGLFTSRRFCPVCESEFKGHDLVPRAVVAGALIVGIFGVGAYMRSSPSASAPQAFRQPSKITAATAQTPAPQAASSAPPASADTQPVQPTTQSRQMDRQTAGAMSVPRYEAAEEAYICGAQTKKGTPCSRRVKGNVRCYQHKGMPAMLAADKLRLN